MYIASVFYFYCLADEPIIAYSNQICIFS